MSKRDGSILSFFSKKIKNDCDNNRIKDDIQKSKVSFFTYSVLIITILFTLFSEFI